MRQLSTILLIIIVTIVAAGCTNLLEDSIEVITPHESTPFVRPPVEQITVQDLDEFRQLLQNLIMTHKEHETIQYTGIEIANLQAELTAISEDIMSSDPVVTYAVTDIMIQATRIVAYFDVEIDIEFQRSAEQIQNIISTSTQRYMSTQLLGKMSDYQEEAIFLTNLQLERQDISNLVTELYYQNPGRIVIKPIATVEIFPEMVLVEPPEEPPADDEPDGADNNGTDVGENGEEEQQDEPGEEEGSEEEQPYHVYEIRFWNPEGMETLREIGENLTTSVQQNAARVDGDNDGEILMSLVENLIAGATYNSEAANTITMHGPPNFAATAFGALVQGSAVGEGFAMAFKALCDELGIDCRVVLGFIDGRYHAWNIVLLDGNFYHIDAAMCAEFGLEAGFLKNDEDFIGQLYSWDMSIAPVCNGPLTINDFMPQEDIPAIDDIEGSNDDENGEDTGNTDVDSGDEEN